MSYRASAIALELPLLPQGERFSTDARAILLRAMGLVAVDAGRAHSGPSAGESRASSLGQKARIDHNIPGDVARLALHFWVSSTVAHSLG